VELQRVLQCCGNVSGRLLVHLLHKTAQPFQVVPDGPVELSRPVTDDTMVRQALIQLIGQVKRGIEPGGGLGHAGTLDLEGLHLMGQRQGLQEQQFDGQLLCLPGRAVEVLPEVRHHGRLRIRRAPFQPFQEFRRGLGRPGHGAAIKC
jgi:hypothetical protein